MIIGFLTYMIVSAAFSVLFLVSSELLPTTIRGRGFALLCASGRVGSILGMQVLKLDGIAKGWIFGCISLSAAISTFMLPETFRQPLVQTLDEAEVQIVTLRQNHNVKESGTVSNKFVLPNKEKDVILMEPM